MQLRNLAVAAVLLVLPGALLAQPGQGRGPMMGMMQQNVARIILEKKDDIGLSAEQVGKLEQVAKSLEEKGEPIREELRRAMQGGGMREMPAEQRERLMARMQALRQQEDEALEKQILPLLDATQQAKAKEAIAAARPPMRRQGER
jgi:hypothetical protein